MSKTATIMELDKVEIPEPVVFPDEDWHEQLRQQMDDPRSGDSSVEEPDEESVERTAVSSGVVIDTLGLRVEHIGHMTEWLIEDPASLRGLGLSPGLSISQVHARLVKIAGSGDFYWAVGTIENGDLIGVAWVEKTSMSTYPVISFLTSPQHRKQWADPFGVAGMKKLFDTLTCKRVITSIPVEFSDSQVRRIIKEGGGNLASYGYQRRLGFRFMGVLPMYFERGE